MMSRRLACSEGSIHVIVNLVIGWDHKVWSPSEPALYSQLHVPFCVSLEIFLTLSEPRFLFPEGEKNNSSYARGCVVRIGG